MGLWDSFAPRMVPEFRGGGAGNPRPPFGGRIGGEGRFTPRQASGLRFRAPHKAGRVAHYARGGVGDRVAESEPRSGDAIVAPHRARHERWCGVGWIHHVPGLEEVVQYARFARVGMELTDLYEAQNCHPHIPHIIARCLARCGAIIASPLRGLDGTTQAPWERGRPRGGRAGIARGEHAVGVLTPGNGTPTQRCAVGARQSRPDFFAVAGRVGIAGRRERCSLNLEGSF